MRVITPVASDRHGKNPANHPIGNRHLERAQRLDRAADLQLYWGRHLRAEQLAKEAELLREGAR
jgi:hypothetical protein